MFSPPQTKQQQKTNKQKTKVVNCVLSRVELQLHSRLSALLKHVCVSFTHAYTHTHLSKQLVKQLLFCSPTCISNLIYLAWCGVSCIVLSLFYLLVFGYYFI